MTKNTKQKETQPMKYSGIKRNCIIRSISNKMSNYFNNEKCSVDNIANNTDGYTRDETKNDRPEVFIEKSDVKKVLVGNYLDKHL